MNRLSRGALLLAIAVVLQSLRLIIPIPLQISTFIIGTLVHLMLVVARYYSSRTAAFLMGAILPVSAYAQGQLLLPVLIPLVMLGNVLFVHLLPRERKGLRTLSGWFLPPFGKALVMGLGAFVLLVLLGFGNPAVQKLLLFGMTVPQLVTGIAGILFANYLFKHIKI